jgi:hypothetical protein
MALVFRKFANAIYEVERLAEIFELESLAQMVLANHVPAGQLVEHIPDFVALHRRHAPAAWHALSRS